MATGINFTVGATDGAARTGVISTPRGEIRTPAFMPVGTVGTVKGLYLDQVKETGADVILGNTYHLMLRPGAEEVAKLGGLHKFIGWEGPILTDSGGFQVMSLAKIRKITEQGAVFQSHIDGRRYELTPERAMEIQRLLGSDIQMQLDQCLEYPHTDKEAEKAMQLSLRWASHWAPHASTAPLRSLSRTQSGRSIPVPSSDLNKRTASAALESFDGTRSTLL